MFFLALSRPSTGVDAFPPGNLSNGPPLQAYNTAHVKTTMNVLFKILKRLGIYFLLSHSLKISSKNAYFLCGIYTTYIQKIM